MDPSFIVVGVVLSIGLVVVYPMIARKQLAGGEATLANYRAGLSAQRLGMRLVLHTTDPRLGQLLASVLPRLAQVHYVHIVGDGTTLSFLMTPAMGANNEHFFTATNAARSAFASTELIVDALDALVCAFEGRGVPAPRVPSRS